MYNYITEKEVMKHEIKNGKTEIENGKIEFPVDECRCKKPELVGLQPMTNICAVCGGEINKNVIKRSGKTLYYFFS